MNVPQVYIRCWLYSLNNSTVNCDNAAEYEKQFSQITLSWAMLFSVLPLGAVIGCFMGSKLANSIGRKPSLTIMSIFCIAISIALGFSQKVNSYWIFLLERYLLGIVVGNYSTITPIYINEISAKQFLGATGSCFRIGCLVGILLSNVMGFIFANSQTWPILLSVTALPAGIQVVLFLADLSPETPVFLCSTGKLEQAKDTNQILKGKDAILDENHTIKSTNIKQDIAKIFHHPEVKPATIAVITSQALRHLCGINAIFFYSSSIFMSLGLSVKLSELVTVLMSLLNIISVLTSTFLVDKVGRKILLITGYVGMAAMSILMTFLLYFSTQCQNGNLGKGQNCQIITLLPILPICIFIIIYELGPGPIPWILASESVLNDYRAGCQSLGAIFNWVCSFIIGFTFPFFQKLLKEFIFLPFAIICLIAVIYTKFFVVETANKEISQVLMAYGSRKIKSPCL